jgi:predicted AlkP superfamily phosphohydrolase/phosphomutase
MAKKILHIGLDGMNMPLLKRFIAEGALPNFQRMIKEGTINRLLPSIPAWTPTNWAAQVTGAEPGVHGLAGWERRQKTQPWDATRILSWESTDWRAETIWEVAEEAGLKSMITFYPVATWPTLVETGYVVAPGFRDPPFVVSNPVQFYCFLSGIGVSRDQSLAPESEYLTVDRAEEGPPPGSTVVELKPFEGGQNEGLWTCDLPIKLMDGTMDSSLELTVRSTEDGSLKRFMISERGDDGKVLSELKLGEWTDWVIHGFGDEKSRIGSVRFYLLEVSPGGGNFRFCHSQIYPVRGFTYPEGLSEELVDAVGPFFVKNSVSPTDNPQLDAFLTEHLYQGRWIAKAAAYVQEKHGWDLHFCHWHLFDNINHHSVNPADPEGPDYDPETGAWNIEAQKQAYIVADKALEEYLKLADDETYVLAISDHGMIPAHRWCDVDVLLAQKGLLTFKANGREIDFDKSRVYTLATRGSEVFVNLEGREPMGIVPAEEYEAVQEMVIDTLLEWRDELTGKRPIALALKLKDSQIIGFWGEDQGDVVFTYNGGFGWGAVYERGASAEPVVNRQSIGPGRGALHGSMVPSTETPLFTNMGCMIMTGPGIKAGYERDWKRFGLMREIDIAPTLSHILGLRPPAQNNGAVLHDIFEEPGSG